MPSKTTFPLILLDLGRVRHAAVKQRIGKGGGDRRAEESVPCCRNRSNHLCRPALRRARSNPHRFRSATLDALRGFDMCGDRDSRSRCACSQTAFTISGGIFSSPGTPFSFASSTPPVIISFIKIDALALRAGKKLHVRLPASNALCRGRYRTGHVAAGHGNALIGCQDLRAAGTSPAAISSRRRVSKVAEPAHGADRRNAAQQLKLCITLAPSGTRPPASGRSLIRSF